MYHTSPPSRILPRKSSLPQYGASTHEPTVIPVISFEKNLGLSFNEKTEQRLNTLKTGCDQKKKTEN